MTHSIKASSGSAPTIRARTRGVLARLAAVAGLLSMSGCAMYNHEFSPPPPPSGYTLHVVQSDDYGSLWNTAAAQAALKDVEDSSQRRNTLVVLFIHGWNHNAEDTDPHLIEFMKTMTQLKAELAKSTRSSAPHETAPESQDFNLVAIYVGWRGITLPSALNYLTFWGRKNAAERVGEGDVSEFILRLQRIYLNSNAYDPKIATTANRPFTGLVTIGHSFGAQVLWKTISREIEEPLAERAPCMSNVLDPSAAGPCHDQEHQPIDQLGDLNILLNPALEAYQYARVDALYRQVAFPCQQTPQVVVFSAENDYARKIWFPLGRAFTGPFRPNFRAGYQGTLYGQALGEVDSQLTHTLMPAPGASDTLSTDAPASDDDTILEQDFTDDVVFHGVRLTPSVAAPDSADPPPPRRIRNSPVMVVKTSKEIIDGHSGIFKPDFREFLTRYVAFIERKRLLVRQMRLERREHPDSAAAREAICPRGTDVAQTP